MKLKTCSKCRQSKLPSEFRPEPRAMDGLRYSCLECDRRVNRAYVERNREVRRLKQQESRRADPRRHRAYQLKHYAKNRAALLVRGAKRRADKNSLPFDLYPHVKEIQCRIDAGKCELSGIALDLYAPARAYNCPSLDRIIPAKGYLYSNVRVVCQAMNCALGSWGEAALEQVVRAWLARKA